MRNEAATLSNVRRLAGFTILELLVSLLIFSILSSLALKQLFQTTVTAHDRSVKTEAEQVARSLLDMISHELRLAGAGMPLQQDQFEDTALYGDAPLPILPSSDADSLVMRVNERGIYTTLTASYTPSLITLDFPVLSAQDFIIGDIIYLSDMMVGGEQALKGEVLDITGNTLTIQDDYVASAGATFKSGTTVNRITSVTYESPTSNTGVTRDSGEGALLLEPKSTMSLQYLDAAGNPISLPLTAAKIQNDLYTVAVTVTVRGLKKLRDGSAYVATATQDVTLRNLVISR